MVPCWRSSGRRVSSWRSTWSTVTGRCSPSPASGSPPWRGHPTVSIAFVCASGEQGPDDFVPPTDICVIAADGSAGRVTEYDGPNDAGPAWSPDGTAILFTSSDFSTGQAEVVVAPAASGAPRSLAVGFSPTWSPDGRQIAFIAPDGGIQLIDVESGASSVISVDPGAGRTGVGTGRLSRRLAAIAAALLIAACSGGDTRSPRPTSEPTAPPSTATDRTTVMSGEQMLPTTTTLLEPLPLTVEPASGLVDGQIVQVTRSGLRAADGVVVGECVDAARTRSTTANRRYGPGRRDASRSSRTARSRRSSACSHASRPVAVRRSIVGPGDRMPDRCGVCAEQ